MARAKRTDRAAARRRYRSEQGLPEFDEDLDAEIGETEEASGEAKAASGTATPARRSVFGAAREAFRPLDVRADLRALPELIRNKALWIPVLVTLVTTVMFVVIRPEGRTDPVAIVAVFLYQYFIVTPAIGGVFIAGFLAPRASWLLGVIVGIVAATCYSFLVLSGFIGIAPNVETQTLARDVVLASYLMSPLIGAFFASTAAWYRRFLYLSNPNRGRARAGAAQRPDGRRRSGGPGQKAGARR